MEYGNGSSAEPHPSPDGRPANPPPAVPQAPSYHQAMDAGAGFGSAAASAAAYGPNMGAVGTLAPQDSVPGLNTYLMVQQQPPNSASLYNLRPDQGAYYYASPAGPHPGQTMLSGISHPQLSASQQYTGLQPVANPALVLAGGLAPSSSQSHALPPLGPVPGGGGFSSYSQYTDQPEMLAPVQIPSQISPQMGGANISTQKYPGDDLAQNKKFQASRRRAITRTEEELLERYGSLHDPDSEDTAAALRADFLNGVAAPSKTDADTAGDSKGIDQRMYRLAQHLLQLPLTEIVTRVKEDEYGPLAEKSRQMFAMTWLLRACQVESDATTPRNRVYARYITACTRYGLRPVNQAALGKLVRMIFPNARVRRLGVRGQSRYRYCGIAMLDDVDGATEASEQSDKLIEDNSTEREGSREDASPLGRGGSCENEKTALLNVQIAQQQQQLLIHTEMGKDFVSVAKCFDVQYIPTVDQVLPENFFVAAQKHLKIPPIAPYAQGFDEDLQQTLSGLVHTECRQALQALRVCDANQFLTALTAIYGRLTTPLLKAAASSSMLKWFRLCDSALFAAILNALYPATFLLPPENFVVCLQTITARMTRQRQERLKARQQEQAQPDFGLANRHSMQVLLESREDTAAAFAQRLVRLVRVSCASRPAAEALTRGELMAAEWEKYVSVSAASEAFYNNVLAAQALTSVPQILHTVGNVFAQKALASAAACEKPPALSKEEQMAILEPWLGLIVKAIVPPYEYPARASVASYSLVFSAALRDISRAQGKSLTSWWVFRCWADEGLWCKVDLGEANMEAETGVLLCSEAKAEDALTMESTPIDDSPTEEHPGHA